MPRRTPVTIRLSDTGLAAVQALAAAETDDNLSDMVRKLLTEALTARAQRVAFAATVRRVNTEPPDECDDPGWDERTANAPGRYGS